MTFFEQAFQPLRKYADFSGRASRGEFWTFFFVVMVAQALARVVDIVFLRGSYLPGPVAGIVGLLLIVPQLAVAVRRLHDVNCSGRELIAPLLMLLAMPLVVLFGSVLGKIVALGYSGLVLIVFGMLLLQLIKEGSKVPNKYGAAPTAFSFAR